MNAQNPESIKAWLIRNCPNFYFMPSLRYDRVFAKWGTIEDKMSPAYWQTRGFKVEPLVACDEEEATHFLVHHADGRYDDFYENFRNGFTAEAVRCSRELDKVVTPVKPLSATV